jgi:hypothetical protein
MVKTAFSFTQIPVPEIVGVVKLDGAALTVTAADAGEVQPALVTVKV